MITYENNIPEEAPGTAKAVESSIVDRFARKVNKVTHTTHLEVLANVSTPEALAYYHTLTELYLEALERASILIQNNVNTGEA